MATVLNTFVAAPRSAFAGRRVSARASNGTMRTSAKLSWCPGGEGKLNPSYLDGSLAGDYGFDPLELGAVPANLVRFQEAEIIHGRWAMLGAAGVIAVEALGFGDWISAAVVPSPTYFGVAVPFDAKTVVAIEVVAMAWAESARQNQTDASKRCYPGGSFDPMGMSKDAKNFETMKLKEIKNGRLAMVACLGFAGQAGSTGTTPLANLAAHLADPFHVSVAQNPVALPFL